ncbi:MAG TPA: MBL fold metallo-hydrolase [Bacteroidales bacterium]|nr:MBL fold metallo-hydrolase [Bacteroidales bacterium]
MSGENAKILVDTGPGFLWKILEKRLDMLGIEKLDMLILTHSHFDHAANAARIKEKYNARIVMHKSEAEFLMKGDNILPCGTNRFSRFIVKTFAGRFRKIAAYEPCNPDVLIDDEFEPESIGLNAFLIPTPGHTRGSVSIIIENEIALVGDTMFGIFRKSVFPPFANDVPELLRSWNKLLSTGCSLFIPSHGSANKRSLVEEDLYKRSLPKVI